MRDAAGCAGVSTRVWHPLSGLDYTGRLRITLPAQAGGAMLLFVGDAIPLDVEASTEADDPVPLHQERLTAGPGVLVPPDFWLDDGSPEHAPRQITRLQIDAPDLRPQVVTLALGRRAPRVLARLVGYAPTIRVPVCADPLAANEIYYATGWFGQEQHPVAGTVRWMREHGALLLASADGRGVRLRVRAAPAVDPRGMDSTELSVRVNDVWEPAPVPLGAGFHDYQWSVPDHAWVTGTNEVLLRVSRTRANGTRRVGLALASLDVR